MKNLVRKLRLAKKWSQRELAKRILTNQQRIQDVEIGDASQTMRLEVAIRIATVLGEPLERVFPPAQPVMKRILAHGSARGQAGNRLFSPEWVDSWKEAGFETEVARYEFVYRMSNGLGGVIPMDSQAKRAAWSAVQGGPGMIWIDADDGKHYVLNTGHLVYCQFLLDSDPQRYAVEVVEDANPDRDDLPSDDASPGEGDPIRVFFVGSKEAEEFLLPVDEPEDDDNPGQLNTLLTSVDSYSSDGDDTWHLEDIDGEHVFLKPRQLVLMEIPWGLVGTDEDFHEQPDGFDKGDE